MVTWNELVEEAAGRLDKSGVPEPSISARWIARQATGTDNAEWLDVADEPASKRQLASFDGMVERRVAGEPLQYVLGSWGFRQLDLFVDHRVLIPRPETEVVAGRAIDELARVGQRSPKPVVADLGTGSGAIGLSLAFEHPGTEVWLTDVSAEALQVARANLAGIGRAGGGVRLAEGRWFDALSLELRGRLAVVVSNPPYVASAADLEPQVAAWEPGLALLADDDGTAHLVELIDEAPSWLIGHGSLVLEMAPDQVDRMTEWAAERFGEVETIVDLAGRPGAWWLDSQANSGPMQISVDRVCYPYQGWPGGTATCSDATTNSIPIGSDRWASSKGSPPVNSTPSQDSASGSR